jgi:hypothetical protein
MNRQVNISSLPDAKARKKTGARREFSLEFNKHWDRLAYAQLRFLNDIFQYAAVGTNASIRKRRKVGHRIDDLTNAICRSDAFAGRLGDTSGSEQRKYEQGILASFLIQRAVPFVEFWLEAIEALDSGVPLEIKPKDIPIWFDEVPGDADTAAVPK